jgi:hypothetical protein
MKIRFHLMIKTFLVFALAAVTFSSFADESLGRPMRGPPTEAINACTGKPEGTNCSFTDRFNQTLNGSCHTGPMGVLACRPKPPQQAFDACVGKKEGDACEFMGRMSHTVKGVCHKGPATEGGLACRHNKMMEATPETSEPQAPN